MALIRERRDPTDWTAGELDGSRWLTTLREQDRAELLAAADGASVEFPLPGLSSLLSGVADELRHGRGFTVLRGIPVAGLTERQCEDLAVRLAGYVGRVVPQPDGRPFVHVRDRGVDPAAPTARSYQHNAAVGFHSDPTDVVALLCVRPALSGGRSIVVSAVAVHNAMVREHPELAEVLYEPWWRDLRRGDDPDGFAASPVFAVDEQDRLVADYGPDYIRSAQRSPHVPRLTRRQRDAMAAMDELMSRLAVTMDFQPGDMQFLNNHAVWHRRTEYHDDPDPASGRDLIRIWLEGLDR